MLFSMNRLHSAAFIALLSIPLVWTRAKQMTRIINQTIEREIQKQKALILQEWCTSNNPLLSLNLSEFYSASMQKLVSTYGNQFQQHLQ